MGRKINLSKQAEFEYNCLMTQPQSQIIAQFDNITITERLITCDGSSYPISDITSVEVRDVSWHWTTWLIAAGGFVVFFLFPPAGIFFIFWGLLWGIGHPCLIRRLDVILRLKSRDVILKKYSAFRFKASEMQDSAANATKAADMILASLAKTHQSTPPSLS